VADIEVEPVADDERGWIGGEASRMIGFEPGAGPAEGWPEDPAATAKAKAGIAARPKRRS